LIADHVVFLFFSISPLDSGYNGRFLLMYSFPIGFQSMTTQSIFGDISVETFLEDYWQKKPLLIKNAFPEAESWISADELAGLSLEENIESRIVQELEGSQWSLRTGPFSESELQAMPDNKWTLLIQAIDHYLPEFSQLMDAFNFIPNWRIDDVMVSYATDGGSVGPHYDHYDVFLIQGSGQRHWQVGQLCDDETSLLPDLPVRILSDFKEAQSWVVNPGDMLYLPPAMAHNGVAVGECMTISVGFRAPSHKEIMSHFADFMLDKYHDDQRLNDPELSQQASTGWLAPTAIQKIQRVLQAASEDTDAIRQWFAQYQSKPKYEEVNLQADVDISGGDVMNYVNQGSDFYRDESSRFLYVGSETLPEALYINGESIAFPASASELCRIVCDNRVLLSGDLLAVLGDEANLEFFTGLVREGLIYCDVDEV